MVRISIVLVEPKHEGNIGFIARTMCNFELDDLVLVDPLTELGEEARSCAKHGKEVLERARRMEFESLWEEFDFVIGTTSTRKLDPRSPRVAISPEELVSRLKEVDGKLAILFGREDEGLSNEQLERCDVVVSIPASESYPVLNISHAAAILFYELFERAEVKLPKKMERASGKEKEVLIHNLSLLLDVLNYPKFKKDVALRMFRKVTGRAFITAKEARALTGVFKKARRRVK